MSTDPASCRFVEPANVLRHLGGTATRADVLRHCPRSALERAVREQELEKIGRGKYSLPALAEPLKVAASCHGELSHESAAAYWLMEAVCKPTAVHVTVPRRAHRLATKLATKSVILLYAEPDGERVTSPLRTVLDCSRTMPFREALAIADSALRRELMTAYELRAVADQLTGPGSRMARRVAQRADPRAANPFESALRATVIGAQVGGFIPQLTIGGTGYRVDLADPDRMIVLEADSFTHHTHPAAFERDCRRYDELMRLGWRVLRFCWDQVMFDETWVTGILVDVCRLAENRRGGSRGRSRLWSPAQSN